MKPYLFARAFPAVSMMVFLLMVSACIVLASPQAASSNAQNTKAQTPARDAKKSTAATKTASEQYAEVDVDELSIHLETGIKSVGYNADRTLAGVDAIVTKFTIADKPVELVTDKISVDQNDQRFATISTKQLGTIRLRFGQFGGGSVWLTPSQKKAVLTLKAANSPKPTNIFAALDDDNLANAKAIIAADPKAVNARNEQGLSPLYVFAQLEPYSTVPLVAELLVSKGADVNAKNPAGVPLLMAAIFRDHPGLVRLLIKSGANVNSAIDSGITPLILAATKGDLETSKQLVAAGAKIDLPDKDGRTPLFAAATSGHSAIVELLLQKGAAVNAKDTKGRTPLKGATTGNTQGAANDAEYQKAVALLRKAGGIE